MTGKIENVAHAVPDMPAAVAFETLPAPLLRVVRSQVLDANAAARALLQARDPDALIGRALDEIVTMPETGPDSTEGSSASTGWLQATAKRGDGSEVEVLMRRSGDAGTSPQDATIIALAPLESVRAGRSETGVRVTTHDQIVRLFANLAHEMRTPLNAVIGFGQIVAGKHFGPLNDKYSAYADDIVGAGQHLLGLVNGALDRGRAGAGSDSLDERTVELRELVKSALSLVERNAAMKSLGISLPDMATLPVIYADETQLRQVLIILLNNAIKYTTPRRHIGISYETLDDDLRLTVWDNGHGMTADELETAMLPFGRTETAMRAGEAGTGLGLPICKAIAEAHDGALFVASTPGRGTKVTICLPASRIVAEPGVGGLLSLI
jgi:signal transduction histidine kinase